MVSGCHEKHTLTAGDFLVLQEALSNMDVPRAQINTRGLASVKA